MSLKEDMERVQKKVEIIEQESIALSILSDFKKQNRRIYIIWIITFITFIALLGYTIFLLNDIEVIEDTKSIDIQDVETIDNSHIKIGDDIWEKSN